MQNIRAGLIAVGFISFTLPLMLVQYTLLATKSRHRHSFPRWYHQNVCKLVGIRVHQSGAFKSDGAVFLVSNHTSWVDISVLASLAPLSFVAKKEVASWPLFGWLAKLQRTVFVDRQRRTKSGQTKGEIASRLLQGETIVLFPEGTSSDGNQVLPFKTALFAAAEVNDHEDNTGDNSPIYVQTASVAYTHRHGMPMGRKGRPVVAWYGDMDLMGHMWGVFKQGPYDVHVHISDPIPLEEVSDRKELARKSEGAVKENLAQLLSGAN